MLTAWSTGFAAAFSLILAIGSQNAFVLRQGLKRDHVFWLCLLCAVSDAILITIGVAGFGAIESYFPGFPLLMAWVGSLFLLAYGGLRFIAAYNGQYHLELTGKSDGLWRTLVIGLTFTWLNPHVYLDTLGLIGAISTRFTHLSDKTSFAAGAISASFIFFFMLGYGARLLAPIMTSTKAWRYLDLLIGATMWFLAINLLKVVL